MSSAEHERTVETMKPAGLRVAILLALIAMIGPLYIDIMPAIIAALQAGYGLTPAQAGFVAAANGYGSTLGALLALFIVPRLPWRPLAALLLIGLGLADAATTAATGYAALIGLRALHGIMGGLLVGLCYALIARTAEPRQGFGVLFLFHFGFGGLGVVASTLLAPYLAQASVFLVLAAFAALSLLILPLLPAFERFSATVPLRVAEAWTSRKWLPRRNALRIGGLFLFQAANLGLGAFLISISGAFGLSPGFAGTAVGIGLWAGVPGALLMMRLTRSFGWAPLVPVVVAAGLSKLLVGLGQEPAMFSVAVGLVFFTMAMALPYAFALCSEGDETGRSAIWAGFASKLGLSTGPAVGGLVYGGGPWALIWAAVAAALVGGALFALSLRRAPIAVRL